MASTPVTVENNLGQPRESEGDGNSRFIRVIVADTQAIFRAGLRKIFALEDDIRVVGQSAVFIAAQSPAHAERIPYCFLRHAGHEEQRNCATCRDNRAGSQKLSAQSV